MSPDFRELVGEEGSPEELERLRRTHDLLVAAGPPPELSPDLVGPPETPSSAEVSLLPRRHRLSAWLVAAAIVAVFFGIGYLVGNRGSEMPTQRLVVMQGVGTLASAKASIRVGAEDGHGNWPLVLSVDGLRKLSEGSWYELYITRGGKLSESCGTFNTGAGSTTVRFSVPYSLNDVGWAVTAHVRGAPASRNRVLLTTA
jgi:hypothetical protein